jgi:hypothetical protein
MASYKRIQLDTTDTTDAADNSANSLEASAPDIFLQPAFRRESSSYAGRVTNLAISLAMHDAQEDTQSDYTGEAKKAGVSHHLLRPSAIRRVPVGSKHELSSAYSVSTQLADDRSSTSTNKHTSGESAQSLAAEFDWHATRRHKFYADGSGCSSNGDILKSKMSWLSISIPVLAIFSTTFSAIYLVIAISRPNWGKKIGTNGHMSISTATLLSALFAKAIELSFVTIFVAFLGQVLTRRALRSSGWHQCGRDDNEKLGCTARVSTDTVGDSFNLGGNVSGCHDAPRSLRCNSVHNCCGSASSAKTQGYSAEQSLAGSGLWSLCQLCPHCR